MQQGHYNPGQDSAKPAGEIPGQNKNSVPLESKDQGNKTAATATDPVPGLLPATITYVVDGDTVHVTLADDKEEKVRYIDKRSRGIVFVSYIFT